MTSTKRLYVVALLVIAPLLQGCGSFRPMANFTLEPEAGSAPLEVTFTNHSRPDSGLLLRYRWDFGDGSPPSTLKAPSHVYETPGIYSVSLTIFTATGQDTMTRPGAVHVTAPEAEGAADFDATPPAGYAPLTVLFTDKTTTGSAAIKSWRWQFGDGATSNEQHPQHTYHIPGAYTVSLTVDTDSGSFRSVKPSYISVESPAGLLAAQRELVPNTPIMPGDYVRVNVVITNSAAISPASLTLRELLPAGWKFSDVLEIGAPPDQIQANDANNDIAFAWLDMPSFPLQFTYRIQALTGCEETSMLTGELNFRFAGPVFTSLLEDTILQCVIVVEGESVEGEGEPVEGEGEPTEGEGEPTEGEGEPAEGEGEPAEGEGEPAEGEGEPTEGEGEPTEGEGEFLEGEAENYIALYMSRSDATGNYVYTPGQQLEITIHVEKFGAGRPTNIRINEQLPANWTFEGLTGGALPEQFPPNGSSGELIFAWMATAPALPFSFSYAVTPPATTTAALFSGVAQYGLGGMDFLSNEAQTYFRRFETLIATYRTTSPPAYIPGSSLEVTIHYASYGIELPLAFGILETIPPGWTYHEIVNHKGPSPVITPASGAAGRLEFAWIEPPPMPGSFTYRVNIPATTEGQAHFSGYGLYRFMGAEQQTAHSDIFIPMSQP